MFFSIFLNFFLFFFIHFFVFLFIFLAERSGAKEVSLSFCRLDLQGVGDRSGAEVMMFVTLSSLIEGGNDVSLLVDFA